MYGDIYAVQDLAPPGVLAWDADAQLLWSESSTNYNAVARDSERLYACTNTTVELWSFDGTYQSTVDLSATVSGGDSIVYIAHRDGDFYIGTSQGRVHRFDGSFSLVWSQTDPGGFPEGASGFVFDATGIYYVTANMYLAGANAVQKLNRATGAVLWGPYYLGTVEGDYLGNVRTVALAGGRLFLGTYEGVVAEIDPASPAATGSTVEHLNQVRLPGSTFVEGLTPSGGELAVFSTEFSGGNRVPYVYRLSYGLSYTQTSLALSGHGTDSGSEYNVTQVGDAHIIYSSTSSHVWSYDPSAHSQNWYLDVWSEPESPYMLSVAEELFPLRALEERIDGRLRSQRLDFQD